MMIVVEDDDDDDDDDDDSRPKVGWIHTPKEESEENPTNQAKKVSMSTTTSIDDGVRALRALEDCEGRANLTGLVRGAVSRPNFARKDAFESSRRDLHNALLCTAL